MTVLRRFVSWWEVSWSWDVVKGLEEVHRLTESVTVIREVLKVLKMNVSYWRGVMVMEEVLGGGEV